jgi:AcrR family transcriptional regulator
MTDTVMKELILEASAATVRDHGLTGWTVEEVARVADCAKGLVLYHYGSKQRLLEATAASVAAAHHQARVEAVRGRKGTGALDALLSTLRDEVDSGWFRAWLAFLRWPEGDTRAAADAAAAAARDLHRELSQGLTVPDDRMPEPEAVAALLDGIQLRLLQGDDATRVLAAYERLWLGLLST